MRLLSAVRAVMTFVVCLASTISAAQTRNYCDTVPNRFDAQERPSKHAWDLFISLNHPAVDRKIERGVADCSKPFGAPGSTSVWETWRNALSEVYLNPGKEPPLWGDTTLFDEGPAKVPVMQPAAGKTGIHPLFSRDGIFHNRGGFGETRMNRATYEFVRSQCLYSLEGQQRYAKAVEAGKKPPIQFPADAIEVKAAWIDFDDPQGDKSLPPIPADKRGTYYAVDWTDPSSGAKKTFGLIALHIITKDIRNWFWASFHHKDQPKEAIAITQPDDYGPPKTVTGTVWENYVLGGTQIDFVLPTGEPTILSDHNVEYQFTRSSCMTCHATASISTEISKDDITSMPDAQQRAVCAMTPDAGGGVDQCKPLLGDDAFRPGSNQLVMERGIPDPAWFQRNGKPFYLQTDFVFSIPFRGKHEGTSAVPPRCMW